MASRSCKWGKLKNPVGRRRCKKAPRGRKRLSAYFRKNPGGFEGPRRRRRR
jgi:hypothetical protein